LKNPEARITNKARGITKTQEITTKVVKETVLTIMEALEETVRRDKEVLEGTVRQVREDKVETALEIIKETARQVREADSKKVLEGTTTDLDKEQCLLNLLTNRLKTRSRKLLKSLLIKVVSLNLQNTEKTREPTVENRMNVNKRLMLRTDH
jgi:hypothetical protein